MKTVIREDQLCSEKIWLYHDVLAVKSPDDIGGISVWSLRLIEPLVSFEAQAPINERPQLLVVVDDPGDPDVIGRLRDECARLWQNR